MSTPKKAEKKKIAIEIRTYLLVDGGSFFPAMEME